MPALVTFDQPPSWCNRGGQLDRSACVEVRVSEVRRLAGCVIHHGRARPDGRGPTQLVTPLPNERRARNGHGRLATGVWTISARHVDLLHARRKPRILAGDWRTRRAAVMYPPYCDPHATFPHRLPHNALAARPMDAALDGNPNKGATRSKMIGLHLDWSQPLRIEKWMFEHRIRPAYYLICPAMFMLHNSPLPPRRGRGVPVNDPRLPPLSSCPAGRKATGCPQRTLKLLLVQCTAAEDRDAMLAQLWIDSLPQLVRAPQRETIQRLMQRYGPIMEPRTLMCARCLGVRYGNHPETVRQAWRRRMGKPDARPRCGTATRA